MQTSESLSPEWMCSVGLMSQDLALTASQNNSSVSMPPAWEVGKKKKKKAYKTHYLTQNTEMRSFSATSVRQVTWNV